MAAEVVGPGVLVTGASGFIGRALLRRLLERGADVVCTSRQPVRDPLDGSTWVHGDVADPDFVDELVAKVRPTTVFHLASEVTGSRAIDAVLPTLSSNLVATVNMLKAVTDQGCGRLVLIGSGDEPEDGAAPCSPYAATKWAVGGYARMFHALYGTPVTTARPFMVYGPDQPDTSKVVPYTITSLLRNEVPVLSSGERLCDWVYIDDVVDALLAIADAPSCIDRRVDIGTGSPRTVREVVEVLCAIVDGDVEPVFGGRADRPGETQAFADAAETARLCGWSPSTDLRCGLERTVAWYRDR